MEPQVEQTENGFTCSVSERHEMLVFFAYRQSDKASLRIEIPSCNHWQDIWREFVRMVRGIVEC